VRTHTARRQTKLGEVDSCWSGRVVADGSLRWTEIQSVEAELRSEREQLSRRGAAKNGRSLYSQQNGCRPGYYPCSTDQNPPTGGTYLWNSNLLPCDQTSRLRSSRRASLVGGLPEPRSQREFHDASGFRLADCWTMASTKIVGVRPKWLLRLGARGHSPLALMH
jgi:hypothetical protein